MPSMILDIYSHLYTILEGFMHFEMYDVGIKEFKVSCLCLVAVLVTIFICMYRYTPKNQKPGTDKVESQDNQGIIHQSDHMSLTAFT